MKKTIIIALTLFASISVYSQSYMTRTGTITFFSEAPLENIEAVNNQVSGAIDLSTGEVAFTLLMKAFTFEKALMQEHFNEKYVHSDKYPKATFKGMITDIEKIEVGSNDKKVIIKGELTMHGETEQIEVEGYLRKKGDNLMGRSEFTINLSDFNISIPSAVKDNISETIDVKVDMDYELL